MSSSNKNWPEKPWPTLPDDKAAEDFVDNADLSEYDWNAAEPISYEFKKKSSALTMRIPQSLLDAVKTKAKSKGIPFTRYVRMLIEQDLARP
ncbi:CopG family antitoxin [Pseudochelatococcus contaminans]|uniref:Putative DNA binding CopG/RHH family protein n=1 Tax=Pseudochelatococcus contaminans TaxID=1538103 RepID=A0A7W6EI42_9HYPH|nr:CopG family antitoxin [Pseudochelatococcus contaminans]MBB3810711.1 putative DNA binding CopG/RHH family protein [Pseudochelatococcus contaminans]